MGREGGAPAFSRIARQLRKAKVVALMADAEPLAEVDLDRAIELLHNFPDLWDGEPDPKERQRFVQLVFDRIDVEAGHLVAVQPRSALLPLFTEREGVQSGTRTRDLRRDRSDREGGKTGQIRLFEAESEGSVDDTGPAEK